VIGHAGDFTGSLDGVVVGKIENGILVELGNHWNPAVSSRRSHVLSEGITISARGGLGNGGFQNIIGARST